MLSFTGTSNNFCISFFLLFAYYLVLNDSRLGNVNDINNAQHSIKQYI